MSAEINDESQTEKFVKSNGINIYFVGGSPLPSKHPNSLAWPQAMSNTRMLGM